MPQYYPTEYLELNIARGLVKGVSHVHKFGAAPEMSNGTTGSVWDVSETLYPWSAFNSGASVLTIDCASTDEVGGQVSIQGLDANYELQTEVVDLTTQNGNTTENTFIRVFRAYYIDQTALTNTGNINIKVGVTTVARITAGKGQTLMAIYTVPAGHTAYLQKGSCGTVSTDSVSGDMMVRYFGQNNFRIGHAFETTGQYTYDFPVPLAIPEKSDIDVRISLIVGNNIRVSAAFDMILIKDGLN